MTIKIKYFFAVLFLSLSLTSGFSQEGTTVTGGDGSGSGGTIAYSVGQVFYTTISSSTGKATQGIQQSYEILSVGLDAMPLLGLSVFPNPTIDQLILDVQGIQNEKLTYQLFDLEGKLIDCLLYTSPSPRDRG